MEDLGEEELNKIIGQFQLQVLNPILNPLRRYGQGEYVDLITPELINQFWILHWKLEGLDIPYELPRLTYTP